MSRIDLDKTQMNGVQNLASLQKFVSSSFLAKQLLKPKRAVDS